MAIQFQADEIPEDAISLVSLRVKEQRAQASLVAQLQEQLKQEEAKLRWLEEVGLPESMTAIGFAELKLDTGETVSIKPEYHAAIRKTDEAAAYDWLRASGNGSLIKRELKLLFGKGEDADAERVAGVLTDMGLLVEERVSVNPQTLKAFVRERIEAGAELPESIGVHVINRAKVTAPKG